MKKRQKPKITLHQDSLGNVRTTKDTEKSLKFPVGEKDHKRRT
jgi:hypothetical protein